MPFRELANFLRAENIPSCVLHGIDPVSGELGRDLDLYVPDQNDAYRTALFFADVLKRSGVRWISLMHPIWGPRCIGIQEQDLSYWELHIMTYVSVACVDFGTMFPMLGSSGAYGFNFNPSLWFIKDVIYKQGRKFARRDPAWTDAPPHSYNLAHQREIETEFQKRWRNGAKFVSAALGPDTPNNLRARQRELFVLMADQCLRRPFSTAATIHRWLGRKLAVLKNASVPVISVDTPMESCDLHQCLLERLGHAFQPIVVMEKPLPHATGRRLQSHQSLLIFNRRRTGNVQPDVENNLISIPSSAERDIEAAVAAILDRIIEFNSHWAGRYQECAQA
jgi:hypothetical protein